MGVAGEEWESGALRNQGMKGWAGFHFPSPNFFHNASNAVDEGANVMPTTDDQEALKRARADAREGKSPSTQAGEFVREEIDHVREGKHGAASVKQAIAIGLSKARRAGVNLPPPAKGPANIRAQARRDLRKGKSPHRRVSRTRSRATLRALRRQRTRSVSSRALSQQARNSARRRGAIARRYAAERAVHTKGKAGLRAAARKAARTSRRRRAA
jgi:Family of unknown function (DUF6496)